MTEQWDDAATDPTATDPSVEEDLDVTALTDGVDDPRIVGAVDALRTLPDLDVDEHPQVFEQIHGALRSALAGGAAPGPA